MNNHGTLTWKAKQLLSCLTASPLRLYLTLAIPVWLFLSWAAFDFQTSLYIFRNDYWEHSATLNAWLKDFLHPGNPHLATDTGTVRYMPFYAVVTLISGALGLDALEAMSVAGFLSITLFVIATPLFANRYFRDPRAGTVALITFLCGWGFGPVFSNLYQMRGLLHVIAFPSFFVFSLSLLLFWQALGILRSDRPNAVSLLVLVVLVAIAFSSHPLTGAFTIGCLMLLAILEPGVAFANRVYLAVAICLGSVLVEFWPYFSTWNTVLGIESGGPPRMVGSEMAGSARVAEVTSWIERSRLATGFSRAVSLALEQPFYRISNVLSTMGPAFFGIPVILYFLATRRQLFIAVGATLMLVPYLINIFFPIPLGHRFLLFFIFFLHLALIWLLLYVMGSQEQDVPQCNRCRNIVAGFLGFILVWNIGLTGAEMGKALLIKHNMISSKNHTVASIVPLMNAIAEYIPQDAVVMAPLYLGWPLPTFSGKIVGTLHKNPLNHDSLVRYRVVGRFFRPATSNDDRTSMLARYMVTHILYNTEQVDPETAMQLDELPGKRNMVGSYTIIRLE